MRSSVLRKSDYALRPLPRVLGEGLDLGRPASRSSIAKPTIAALAERFAAEPPVPGNAETRLPYRETKAASPTAQGANVKGLISALVGVALIPTAILFVLLWRGMMQPHADDPMSPAGPSAVSAASSSASAQRSSAFEVVLSSPDRIEAKAGEEIDFPVAIDATESLPSRSVIAISALPDGAVFSEGRPYGATGWSLRPDEIGELRLRLPQGRNGTSDIRLELLTADGTVLAESETRLNVAADAELVSANESDPFEQIAQVEAPKPTEAVPPAPKPVEAVPPAPQPVEAVPPAPQPKPAASATIAPSVKVAKVKTVPIKPPAPTRPHDGAYALGEAMDDPAEWVEIVKAVDMHARPQQSSETVKVVESGLKLRVGARDKNWVEVTDPATSAHGWIYSRFLKPTDPPAQ
jgi:hypothetical protein